MPPDTDRQLTGAAATAAGSGMWLFLESLTRYGPSWALVPPLLLAVASTLTAVSTLQKSRREDWMARQEERRREELHRARLAKVLIDPPTPAATPAPGPGPGGP